MRPVEYSPAVMSTPRIPTMSWLRLIAPRLIESGLLSAMPGGPLTPPSFPADTAKIAPKITVTRAAEISVTVVERTERNLIHSPRATLRWVAAEVGLVAMVEVITPPPRSRQSRGTRPSQR